MSEVNVVKINFRTKNSGNRRSLKVYTTVRIPGLKPVQIHLGYVAEREEITHGDQLKLTRNLHKRWQELFGHQRVMIDWEDAKRKWSRRKEPKQYRIDRKLGYKRLFELVEQHRLQYEELINIARHVARDTDEPEEFCGWLTLEELPRLIIRWGVDQEPQEFFDAALKRLKHAKIDWLRTKKPKRPNFAG